MRKYIYTLLLATLTLFACTNKNEGLLNLLGDLDGRITALEALCKELNTNVQSIQTIVEAVETGDYITNITPIMQDGKQVGYTITFAKHSAITIYNGENGKDGVNGTDGTTPILGAAKDTDGIYYWTLNGEWLLDGDGHKIRVTGEKGDKGDKGDTGATGAAGQDGQNGSNGTNGTNGTDGVTPQLKIENDYWYISYNNGATWTQLGKAKGDKGDTGAAGTNGNNGQDGDSMFQSVTYDENNVYFTLANGTVITISKNNGQQAPNTTYSGIYNGFAYVDLGLPSGIMWATMNVGANAIQEVGNLYAWAETAPKEEYLETNYIYYEGGSYTKYISSTKIQLDLSDDAAAVNMGGLWRTPTPAEWDELSTNCTWVFSTYELEPVYIGCSMYNNKKIIIAANIMSNTLSSGYQNQSCSYMTNTLYTRSSNYYSSIQTWKALYSVVSQKLSMNIGTEQNILKYRYLGYPVRGVFTPANE